jgi:tetratricopeptide (TPR) repeat protein
MSALTERVPGAEGTGILPGRYEEAVTLYKKTIEVDPTLKITFFNLANALKKSGRHDILLFCLLDRRDNGFSSLSG